MCKTRLGRGIWSAVSGLCWLAFFVSTYTEATQEAKDLIRALYAIAGGESDENCDVR